jgi:ABC-type multidrug transport system ATPase subunit
MSLVATNDVEAGKVYELVEAQGIRKEKVSPDMTWVNVNFKAKSKNILTNCWGNVPAGKVCAIMGPSGAGKSSLLNVLAGRSAPAPGITIEGKVTCFTSSCFLG